MEFGNEQSKIVHKTNVSSLMFFRSKNINIFSRRLTVNPEHRPSIDEVLQDRWLDDAEVITKAERLMKMKITITSRQENEENFLPPATKRRRIDRKY